MKLPTPQGAAEMTQQYEAELDHILNVLCVPWDTSDLPPNVRITSPSIKIAEAKKAILASYIPRSKLEKALEEEQYPKTSGSHLTLLARNHLRRELREKLL